MSAKHLLTSASELNAKRQDGSYIYTDYRSDLSSNIGNSSDELIEQSDLHIPSPFAFTVKDILEWSKENESNFSVVNQQVKEHNDDVANKIKNSKVEYLPFAYEDNRVDELPFKIDKLTEITKATEIVAYCTSRINAIRDTFSSDPEELAEIEHRLENIYRINLAKNKLDLQNLETRTMTNEFVLTNSVTVLGNVYENGTDKHPYSKKYRAYTLGELFAKLRNTHINKRAKTSREIVFSNTDGNRPVGSGYRNWSGLQIFDIDLKKSAKFLEIEEKGMTASYMRDELFTHLEKFPWFMSVQLSASKRSLHIYTKVSRMHHLFEDDDMNEQNAKYWYRMSYYQKWAVFAYLLKKLFKLDVVKDNKVIDSAAAKIQQGIALNYDAHAKRSTRFNDYYPVMFYYLAPMAGVKDKDWITNPRYLEQFNRWWQEFDTDDKESKGIVVKTKSNIDWSVDDDVLLTDVQQIDMRNVGDKYSTRWRVCNTMIDLYGDSKDTRELVHHILQSGKYSKPNELEAFMNSAVLHRKNADSNTIRMLAKLGLSIKMSEESKEQVKDAEIERIKYAIEHSNYLFDDIVPNKIIKLGQQRSYLWHKHKSIFKALSNYDINIIESPPGTGKTEFFKRLSKTKAVCLVLPFTSTIEAKVETDESISKYYEIYYGKKSIRQLSENRKTSGKTSAVMTFDKFSKLSLSDYKLFDYIVVDESHLLFTSTYRLAVVGKTTDNLRKYAAEELSYSNKINLSIDASLASLTPNIISSAEDIIDSSDSPKLILMSGTVTGEMTYFSYHKMLNYIKVVKKHPYKKKAEFIFTRTNETKQILIYELIAEAISQGRTVIHPTNRGDLYARDISDCVEFILDRDVAWEYYKKSNSDEDFVQDINENETISNTELLFCTDYLSVGIDINDDRKFTIIYDTGFTAEDIEQFNNRIRRADIESKIVYTVLDNDGFMRTDLFKTNTIDLSRTDELVSIMHDDKLLSEIQHEMRTSNKYFSVLGKMFSKYFTVNDKGRIEYIMAAFELDHFEKQYQEIATGLLYVKSSLQRKYGYDLSFSYVLDKTEKEVEKFGVVRKNAKDDHKLKKSMSFISIIDFCMKPENQDIIRSGDAKYKKDTVNLLQNIEGGLLITFDEETSIHTFHYAKYHKFALESAINRATSLMRYYKKETAMRIVKDCANEAGIVNYSELNRYVQLIKLISVDRMNALAPVVKDTLTIMYDYVHSDSERLEFYEYDEMRAKIQSLFHSYIKDSSKVKDFLQSEQYIDKLNNNIDSDFLKIFLKIRKGKETIIVSFRKVHTFDSNRVLMLEDRDEILRRILLSNETAEESRRIAKSNQAIDEVHLIDNFAEEDYADAMTEQGGTLTMK